MRALTAIFTLVAAIGCSRPARADDTKKADQPAPAVPSGDEEAARAAERLPGYVALGVGGVGLVVGLVGVGYAVDQKSKCGVSAPGSPAGACNPAQQSNLGNNQTAAVAGFAVSAMSLAVAVFVLTSDHAPSTARADRDRPVRITPQVGVGWLGMTGTFQ